MKLKAQLKELKAAVSKEYQKKYREEHKDELRKYMKQYRQKHKKKIQKLKKEYRKIHLEKIIEYGKQWRKKHPQYGKEYNKKYYQKHSKKLDAQNKEYKKNNPDKIKIITGRCYRKNPEYHVRRRLKKLYGITPEQKQELFESQNSVCAVCKTSDPGTKPWAFDHDHGTKFARGVLCSICNIMLGLIRDKTERCEQLIAYLNFKPDYNFEVL